MVQIMKFKVGDIVTYTNELSPKYLGSIYEVMEIIELTDLDFLSQWVKNHKATHLIRIKHLTGTNVEKNRKISIEGYYNVCFKLANSKIIRKRLGIK